MESYTVVRPEHLNHFGYLFGGQMLKWVDEIAWIAASRDHPGCSFVTVAMDKGDFRRSVRQGTVLRFEVAQERCGNTSVAYAVQVLAEHPDTGAEAPVFSTHIWFVCLDAQGRKMPLRRV